MGDFHSQQFRHILLIEAREFRRRVSLDAPTYSIGRHPGNSIVIPSQFVSRHHATLVRKKSPEAQNFSFSIIDGNCQGTPSSNGLFVNGKRCSSKAIKHGDVIQFGSGAKAQYLTLEVGGKYFCPGYEMKERLFLAGTITFLLYLFI